MYYICTHIEYTQKITGVISKEAKIEFMTINLDFTRKVSGKKARIKKKKNTTLFPKNCVILNRCTNNGKIR